MSTAREYFDESSSWTDITAQRALPLLLALAKIGRCWTYGDLNRELERRYDLPPSKFIIRYRTVLYKIGNAINLLSDEWQSEIPPLTILITNAQTHLPSEGVNDFLQRYVTAERAGRLTNNNRRAMVDRATNDVYAYDHWDEVAEYFGVPIPINDLRHPSQSEPIVLPPATISMGGESRKHLLLKQHIAAHPELFARLGNFGTGKVEARLNSGDEIDVLFSNDEQALAVEIKTDEAPPGELTRGIYQCVKYRAVLRATFDLAAEPKNVQVLLATPQMLSEEHKNAADRLGVKWKRVSSPN